VNQSTGALFCFGSSGGHIRELRAILDSIGVPRDQVVIGSSRGSQLDELAADGWKTVEVPLVPPRSPGALVRALLPARRVLRELRPRVVLTTGSAIALAFAPFARLAKVKFIYVESLTRVEGPSQTGRLIEMIPGTILRTQSVDWKRRRGPFTRTWTRTTTALDRYRREQSPTHAPTRIFVAVGITTTRYPFDRLLARVREIAPADVEVRIQASEGDTPPAGTTFVGRLTPEALRREIDEADAVVIHAGVGLTLDCLDAGKCPVVVARRAAFREHVDDHQVELAEQLRTAELAMVETVETLSWSTLVDAASARIVQSDDHELGAGGLVDDLGLRASLQRR
jgi:UDP-N-acetylglucosamine transferase subunit ALG13